MSRTKLSVADKKSPLIPALVVGGAFFVGLCVMAVLNKTEVRLIFSQFPALWSVEQNRPLMIVLLFRIVLTAIIFAAISLAGCLLFSSNRSKLQEDTQGGTQTILVQSLTKEDHPSQLVMESQQVPTTPPMPTMSSPHPSQTVSSSSTNIFKEPETVSAALKEPSTPIYIEISLLQTVRMNLCVPHLGKRYPIKIESLNSRARHLIAYLAWQKGKMIKLDTMRTHVFGSEEADLDQVQNAFSTAKRDIRRQIDLAVEEASKELKELKEQALPRDLDIFGMAKNRMYFLPEYCRVIDLSFLEQQMLIISNAELVTAVPHEVQKACAELINAYKGDFLDDLLVEDPDAIDPWPQSWAREPFTHYRDMYLQALLYAGEYERKAGDAAVTPVQKRGHYMNAGRLFTQGAMAACNRRVCDGRFDIEVFFAKNGRRAGQHVTMSEQLIRRGIAAYGMIGNTTQASRAYGLYQQQMLIISAKTWSAHPETLKVVDDALKQTGAYRFPNTIASPYDSLVSA